MDSNDIKGIFTGIILIAVLGFAANMIIGMTPTQQTFETGQQGVWTLENTAPLAIAETADNVHITATGSGSGTATAYDAADVTNIGRSVKSATAEFVYSIDNADNLTAENIILRLEDPDGNVTEIKSISASSTTSGYQSVSQDISGEIDAEGEWTMKVFTEATLDDPGYSQYLDNAEMSITTNVDNLTVIDKLGQYGPYLVMILILALFVGGIAVLLNKLNVL